MQLFQKDDQSLGFSVRGGLEYGCGVFVSEVLPSSKAAQAGLKVNSLFVTLRHGKLSFRAFTTSRVGRMHEYNLYQSGHGHTGQVYLVLNLHTSNMHDIFRQAWDYNGSEIIL